MRDAPFMIANFRQIHFTTYLRLSRVDWLKSGWLVPIVEGQRHWLSVSGMSRHSPPGLTYLLEQSVSPLPAL
jgi:hypothetical protein